MCIWRTSLLSVLCGGLALASSTRDPQNPFPAPTADPQGAGRWSTFWWADYDRDGTLDALVLHPSAPARLYRNAGEGRFEDVTQQAGLAGILGARQALWADFDGDGRLDLFLAVPDGRSRLLRGIEGGAFEDVSMQSGLGLEQGVLHAELLDFDQDGAPDLLLVTPERERFLRNLGGGMFEEVTLELPPRERAGAPLHGVPTPGEPGGMGEAAPGASPEARGAAEGSGGRVSVSAPATGPTVTGTGAGNQQNASSHFACASSVDDFVNPGFCIGASSDPMLGMLYPISSDWFVSSSGNVGLGTTSPGERLDVVGRIRAAGQIISESQFISTVPVGAPLSVASSTKVTNLNADLLDGLDSSDFRKMADAIGSNDLASSAVTTTKIADSAVTGAKIASNAVTTSKIQASAVTADQIASNAVTTAKIENGAVTGAKLADDAVGGTQLAPNSVDTTHILNGTILNADVSTSAGIAGTKIAPNFGSQNVVTTGRAGIGTTGPNSHLHVNAPVGDNPLRVQIGGGTRFFVGSNGGTTIGAFQDSPPANGLFVAGNVGIGTNTPLRQLSIGDPGLGFERISANTLGVYTSTFERIRVNEFGRVGINTDSPTSRLHVVDSTNGRVLEAYNSTGGGTALSGTVEVSPGGSGTGIAVRAWANPANARAVWAHAGGSSGTGVYARATDTTSSNARAIHGDAWGANGYAGYFTGGRNYFEGRVGIGVTAPSFKLDLPNISSAEGRGRANSWTTYSSKRWKENVETIPDALELVLQMRGVTFDWTEESGGEKGDIGFIAEEIGALLPQLVTWEDDGVHAKSLKYDRIAAVAVEAIKEQQAQIEALELLHGQQASELAAASQRVVELEALVAAQSERLEQVVASVALLFEGQGEGASPEGR